METSVTDKGWVPFGDGLIRRIEAGELCATLMVYEDRSHEYHVAIHGRMLTCGLSDRATAQAAAETALRAFLVSALKALGVDVEAMQVEIAAKDARLAALEAVLSGALASFCSCRGTGTRDVNCVFCNDSGHDHTCVDTTRPCEHVACVRARAVLADSTSALDARDQQVRSEERARIVASIRRSAGSAGATFTNDWRDGMELAAAIAESVTQ